jgi:hypothetical protein
MNRIKMLVLVFAGTAWLALAARCVPTVMDSSELNRKTLEQKAGQFEQEMKSTARALEVNLMATSQALQNSAAEREARLQSTIEALAGRVSGATAIPAAPSEVAEATEQPAAAGGAPYTVIGPQQAMDHIGETVCVAGNVALTNQTAKTYFIDYISKSSGFYGVYFGRWPKANLAGRCAMLCGQIKLYKGRPEIIVDDPNSQALDCR